MNSFDKTLRIVFIIVLAIVFFIIVAVLWMTHCKQKEHKHCDKLDDVIVGFGTSAPPYAVGLAKAGRRVLALEAGPNYTGDPIVIDPNQFAIVGSSFKYTDAYISLSDPNLFGRVSNIPFGKMIGGSMRHNYMQWVTPTPKQGDQWASRAGNRWNYANTRPIVLSSETINLPDRGQSGPLHLSVVGANGFALAILAASAMSTVSGVPYVQDYNGTNVELCASPVAQQSWTPTTPIIRTDTATAYAPPSLVTYDSKGVGKSSSIPLEIRSLCPVTRILIEPGCNGKKPKAIGVEYLDSTTTSGDVLQRVYADHVTVSAGWTTPLVLMRSGIGPKKVLDEAKIPVVLDSPNVGANLKNQLFGSVIVSTTDASLIASIFPALIGAGMGFLPDPVIDPTSRRWQLLVSPFPFLPTELAVSLGFYPFDPTQQVNYFTIAGIDLKPRSTGSIKVTNTDSFSRPVWNSGAYTDGDASDPSSDISSAIRMFKTIRDIVANMAAQQPAANLTVVYPPLPAFNSNDAMSAILKSTTLMTAHPACSCRMDDDSSKGVVNGKGEVHGIDNLSLFDLQISPEIPLGNPSATATLIGNLGAQIRLGKA